MTRYIPQIAVRIDLVWYIIKLMSSDNNLLHWTCTNVL